MSRLINTLYIKRLLTQLGILIFSMVLTGCATTYDHGDGVVISVKKIHNSDYKPHDATSSGAKVGGATGVVGGAAAGGLLGLYVSSVASAFGGISTPAFIGITLAGVATGAIIVGSVGAAAGAGVGYIVDVSNTKAGFYQFIVKPNDSAKPITVRQYSTSIPVNAPVRILEKDDNIFIKRKIAE